MVKPHGLNHNLWFASLLVGFAMIFLSMQQVQGVENFAEGNEQGFRLALENIIHALAMSSTNREQISNDEASSSITVATTSGLVTGADYGDSCAFYGIPYGEKPVRFMESELRTDQGPIDASKPTTVQCYQPCVRDCTDQPRPVETEDCLVLDIFVPRATDVNNHANELLPVMVWIHGGAFVSGSGTHPMYNGEWLSKATNTLVVTINYRLGAFGFLSNIEGGNHLPGNQGHGDQQLALEWVAKNIANFGGDKTQVTIFGQSAGAQSVMFHLASKKSSPYFRRAIMQSNPAAGKYQTVELAQATTNNLMKYVSCTTVECLQNISPEEIVKAHGAVAFAALMNVSSYNLQSLADAGFNFIEPFRPVIGNDEFPTQPMSMFHRGTWNTDKEVILGDAADEMEFFLVQIWPTVSGAVEFFKNWLEKHTFFKIGSLTPATMNSIQRLLTAYAFACPTRNLARHMSATEQTPDQVFLYKFEYGPDAAFVKAANLSELLADKAFHASELSFEFGNIPYGYEFSPSDIIIRDTIASFWKSFTHTGKPSPETSQWPSYTKLAQMNDEVAAWSQVAIDIPRSFVNYNSLWDTLCDQLNDLGVYDAIDPPIEPNSDPTTNAREEL